MFTAVVDCRVDVKLDNDFLTLNLEGKPVFSYIVEELTKVTAVEKVYVLTDSKLVERQAMDLFGKRISVVNEVEKNIQ